jgi:hypothetical protein
MYCRKWVVYLMKIPMNDFSSYTAATLNEDSRQWSVLLCMEMPLVYFVACFQNMLRLVFF